MAKLALTLSIFIAFFVFTHAKRHAHLYLPDDVISSSIHDPPITLPEPESKRTIMLPSEKPESEPASVVGLDLSDSDRIVLDAEPTVIRTVEEEKKKHRFPIEFRDLRPVWGRDTRDDRRMILFRNRHHRCHHAHRRHHPSFYHKFDSDRNDMLVAEEEPEKMVGADKRELPLSLDEGLREDGMGQGGVRRAPSRWLRFHFGGRPHHGPHHHHGHRRDETEEAGGEGLVKRIRKFLHEFEF
uniref:Uncharacterized protein n=1 Tax=Kalanchoe fedtschenkoi TaxID=63787 RepID=A0A7N0VAF6_KALFE